MDPSAQEVMKREAVKVMAALRSRFRRIVPVPLAEHEGCRFCGATGKEKKPYTVSIYSRGLEPGELAIVTLATLCRECQPKDGSREKVLGEAEAAYRKTAGAGIL